LRVDGPRQHEQQIGKPVQIVDDGLVGRLLAVQAHHRPLGPPTDRARDVQRGRLGRAARENEVLQWREPGLVTVDDLLERADVRGLEHFTQLTRIFTREFGAHREEVSLDRLQQAGLERNGLQRRRKSERRVELVDFAIRAHAQMVFGDAAAAEESRLTRVASLRVDLHESGTYRQGQRSASGCSATTVRVAASSATARESLRLTSAISSTRSSVPPPSPATAPRSE